MNLKEKYPADIYELKPFTKSKLKLIEEELFARNEMEWMTHATSIPILTPSASYYR